jgi:rhodanese-related sulfurtransferase
VTALPELAPIAPADAKALVESGRAVLIDIREPMEHARERIVGAHSAPLSKLAADAIAAAAQAGEPAVIFHCQSGNRTAANAARLGEVSPADAYILAGGLNAWKSAGLPVAVNRKAPLELMRQVQIGAGSLAALGAVLALAVSPWFVLLSGFVGAGLVVAGATGFCGMARILAKMPWNKVAAA